MEMQCRSARIALCLAVLAAQFAVTPTQAQDRKTDNIEGVIASRNGDNLALRVKGGSVVNVAITRATTVYELQGPLGLGILPASISQDVLAPGLKIIVEPVSATQKNVAKGIQFDTRDLERLYAIQAALAVPQAQIQALQQELATQKQHNSIQDQALAAGKAADAAIGKRISDLADYDQKAEMVVLFDVNSANLSDRAKADLKAFAEQSKKYRGYLIQVAGYADSVGTSNRNQALSDRRAEMVAHYLQQECDVALSRVLTPVAMGSSNPVAPNETAQGRAENRRVTVKVAVNRGIGE
ncbi:MAG: OmpA family protein [Burkholderiales bacterium]|nr:OmpA family protein [Burkholderiales bacterium]